jgi:hypothetical protein
LEKRQSHQELYHAFEGQLCDGTIIMTVEIC